MRRLAAALTFALAVCSGAPAAGESLSDFVAALDARGAGTVEGADGSWLLTAELRHLAAGRFWGADAASVSRATRKDWADPLPAILDFHRQLEAAGIPLLLVPVPAKAAVLPGALPDAVEALDPGHADRAFMAELREAGVRVLDLTEAFSGTLRAAPYCRTDSHWSGAGVELAAAHIAAVLRTLPGLDAVPRGAYASEVREVEVRGDLSRLPGGEAAPAERLALRFVTTRTPGGPAPVPTDRESPVLLLADSHGLVFHAGGDMLASGAGLPDQLALELGFAVDLVAVRGAASNAARMSLLRRGPAALRAKRAVVWVYAVREWTQSLQGWRLLPLGLDAGS